MEHVNVVAAVIANRGKLLCMQRGITRYQYTSLRWEFPGGKIEEGETEQIFSMPKHPKTEAYISGRFG